MVVMLVLVRPFSFEFEFVTSGVVLRTPESSTAPPMIP